MLEFESQYPGFQCRSSVGGGDGGGGEEGGEGDDEGGEENKQAWSKGRP